MVWRKIRYDGFKVVLQACRLADLTNPKIFDPKLNGDVHPHLRKYIKKHYLPDGSIARTRGRTESNWLANKIMKRALQLATEDLIENRNFVKLSDEVGQLGMLEVYKFAPKLGNRNLNIEFNPGSKMLAQQRRNRKRYLFAPEAQSVKKLIELEQKLYGN